MLRQQTANSKQQTAKLIALFVLSAISFMSCSDSVLNSTNETSFEREQLSKKVPLSERGLDKFSKFEDREYYPRLEDLAYILATQQHEYSQIMSRSMKKSKVKEGILNLTKVNSIDKSNNLAMSVVDKIDVVYEKNSKLKSKKLKVKQLLKRLSHDVNIYFPVVEHRKNVLKNGESYWVAFNPPDHDKTEYFVRAYNQFGKDSLFSSKSAPSENLLVIAYSENQENYSPALMRVNPIDDCDGELYGEECIPGGGGPGPDPDPEPVETEEGINITYLRTKGIDDGYLDGDLEIKIKIYQVGASGNVGGIPYDFSNYSFIDYVRVNHDAGHWYYDWSKFKFKFSDSNKKTYINRRRRLSERKVLVNIPYVGLVYYDEFTLVVREEDVIAEDDLGSHSFNLATETFGVEKQTASGVFVLLDLGQYPISTY